MSLPPAYFFKKNTVLMLKSFIYAFEFRSLTKAAALLHLPVSSISRYISELEESLGYDLLIKVKGKIALTPNGERLYRQANKHLKALEKAMINLEVEQKVIKFATYASAISYVAPLLYKKMRKLMPNIKLEVMVADKEECEAAISRGEIDIGFYAYYYEGSQDKRADLIYKPIGTYIANLVVCSNNPFTKKYKEFESISLSTIAKDSDLKGKFFYTSSFMFKDILKKYGLDNENLTIHANTGIDVLKRFIVENEGFGMFHSSAIHSVERDMFRFYNIEEVKTARRFLIMKNASRNNLLFENIVKNIVANQELYKA
jgi:DNA-binding transcriptional LysR family regulator